MPPSIELDLDQDGQVLGDARGFYFKQAYDFVLCEVLDVIVFVFFLMVFFKTRGCLLNESLSE